MEETSNFGGTAFGWLIVREAEREFLVDLYEKTHGDGWKRNDNWCTDAPVNTWYGITVDEKSGTLETLDLHDNNLRGKFPRNISTLCLLLSLNLADNHLTGHIPGDLNEIECLGELDLRNNCLTGTIPASLGELEFLRVLRLSGNNLTGSIPRELARLPGLEYLHLEKNKLTGDVPREIWELNREGVEVTLEYGIPRDTLYLDFHPWQRPYRGHGEMEHYMKAAAGVARPVVMVITCEGFLPPQMATAEEVMKGAVDYMFAAEPYRSLRDRFDVYLLYACSALPGIDRGGRGTRFGTKIRGNIWCMTEGRKLVEFITGHGFDPRNVQLSVICNSVNIAGITLEEKWMEFGMCVTPADYGIFLHEAGGHAIGKLGDEYGSEGERPYGEVKKLRKSQAVGSCLNLSVTPNPKMVPWHEMLADERYEGLVGIVEGGWATDKGIYRSTGNSVMRRHDVLPRFNAVSRELIYKRVMEWTEGDGWVYSREAFVAFDAPARECREGFFTESSS